jgi:hypothetical protein
MIPKLIFIGANLLGIAVALYKSQTLGLLPTSAADWLATDVRTNIQYADGRIQ